LCCRYKHIHALKWQTFDFPNGMVGDMWGPVGGPHNDRFLLKYSRINTRMALLQQQQHIQYRMYGDGIYCVLSHMRRAYKNAPNTPRQIVKNEANKRTRVSIEWNYGETSNLFQFIDYTKNAKVCGSGGNNIAKCYFIATLMRNCHVCLYHNETSEYFGVEPPALEVYMA